MDMQRLGFRGVVGLALALAAFPACSDDDGDESTSDAGRVTDAGAGNTDAARPDAAAVVVDAGPGSTPVDSGAATDSGAVGDSGAGQKTIVELAVADGRFKTLAKALTDTNLVATLQGAGPFTVFAPTDDAFAKLPAGTLEGLSNDQLATILKYHVVAGELPSTALKAGPVKTAAEFSSFVTLDGSSVKVNASTVTAANVEASNGVVHVIDSVLLPPNIVEAATYGGFTKLVAAVTKAELGSALAAPSPKLTVFAPTDAAFNALPAGTVEGLTPAALGDILKYHVVSGQVLSTELTAGPVPTLLTGKSVAVALTGGVTVNGAKVVIADVLTTNGVIHVIDKVLTPTP
jgi:transforming growth factor-beta-induced protein